ncbi:MAG TPA: flavin reductase [Levilinea sp.]|nr:flavin reductase [Levilinea sp.]
MHLPAIPIAQFIHRSYHLWENQWLLLTSGDFTAGKYNTMTVAWGSFGVMWGKPFAMVVVRPTRHTYSFMEMYDTFTLTAYPERYHKALQMLGSRSGRDGNKIAQAGLTPTAALQVPAPAFAEAELVIECRKIYWDDFKPEHFLDPEIDKNYPGRDYHRIYFGEIVAIAGNDAYWQA